MKFSLSISALVVCNALVTVRVKGTSKDSQDETAEKCKPCEDDYPWSPSALGNFSTWAVSTDAEQCKNVSRRIYAKNGTTVDAAIATLLCMGVVLPHSMGIGGGFIATVYSRTTKKAKVLIARETAPMNATENMFVNKSIYASIWGGLAVAVPGELRGYDALHKYLNGTLKWADLFEDAIQLARCGFPVGKHLAAALREGKVVKTALANETRRFFMKPDTDEVLTEGDTLIQDDLAKTLEDIANNGADYFYTGNFAVNLVEDVKRNGGIMTVQDLNNYSVKWIDPINFTFEDNLTMFSAPPPGSGPVLAYIMAIMDAFRKSGEDLPDDEETLHKFTEACKYSYAKRALLGDVDFVNCQEVIANMTSRKYAEDTKSKINLTHTFDDPKEYGFINETYLPETGTAHAVFWGEDVVISVSSTINFYFGSLVRTNSGVLLNNEMDDFSTPGRLNIYKVAPSRANFIQPGKRPMSSMAPVVVVDPNGDVRLALGGTGGSKITSGIGLVTVRTLWQNKSIKNAIDCPRIHHQLIPNQLMVEKNFSQICENSLRKFGHNVTRPNGRFNVIMGVHKKDGRLYANADYRKGGDIDGI